MPELQWDGKRDAVIAAKNIPAHMLEFDSASSVGESENLIVQGDNLLALRALLPRYKNRVRCIYIDPPYNTHSAFEHYNDNFEHAAWLNLMYPRLELLREFLSDDGAIFISIDDNEQAYLKVICDEIFGANNFIGAYVKQSKIGGGNDSKFIVKEHEYCLVYARDINSTREMFMPHDEDYLKRYKECDENGRYFWDTYARPGLQLKENDSLNYPITFPDGTIIQTRWRRSKERFQQDLHDGIVRLTKKKDGTWSVQFKQYLNDKGKKPRSMTMDFGGSQDGRKDLMKIFGDDKIFSYPKSLKFLQTLLSIATDKDSIVLDCFAGSGTTGHAVINLNNNDGGERKFILIEEKEYCKTITAERVKRVGGSFKFARLGEKLFAEDGAINPHVTAEDLAAHIWFNLTGMALAEKFSLPLIGIHAGAAIYLLKNILTKKIFDELPTFDGQKIIYGNACRLDEDFLRENKIIFKHLPTKI